MNLCNEKHEEICFEGRKCPLCDMRDDLNHEVDSLMKELDAIKTALEDARMDADGREDVG